MNPLSSTARAHPRTRSRGVAAAIALTLLATLLGTGAPSPVAAAEAGPAKAIADGGELSAEIRRTEYGIPHVKADDWGGLGYGYGYAFAEDNICLLAEEVVTGNGDRSQYFGATDSNFQRDLFHQQLIDLGVIEETLSRPADAAAPGPSPRVRDLIRGTAEGYNRYLSDVGGAAGISDPRCSGAPWVRDIDELDLWRTYLDSAVRAGRGALEGNVVGAQPPDAAPVATAADRSSLDDLAQPAVEELGSNAYGLGSEATQAGTGMLLGNPHFPWDGRDRFYEMHLTIPGEYDMIGAALSGQPVVEIGHNETMGWSHTVSTARRFTIYQLDLVPGHPTQYYVDGQVRDMTSQQVDVAVDDGVGGTTTRSRTLWTSEYGPIIEISPLDWTGTTAYALKDVNEDAGRTFDGYIEMGRSGSVAELEQTLDTWQHLPWINTIAADSTGAAFYGDHSVVPHVDQAELDACITPIGQLALPTQGVFILDGSDSGCGWGSDPDARVPGIFGPSNLPTITRSDYVTNSNDSYWLANPEQPLEGFDRIIGVERTERSLRTRLGLLQVQQRIAGTDGLPGQGFSLDLLQQVMFSNRVYGGELVRDDLVAACRANPTVAVDGGVVDISEACDVLAAWDLRVDLDSRGAHVFREFANGGGLRFAVPFDAADPVNTPNTLDTSNPAVLQALARPSSASGPTASPSTPAWATSRARPATARSSPSPAAPGAPARSTSSAPATTGPTATPTCGPAPASCWPPSSGPTARRAGRCWPTPTPPTRPHPTTPIRPGCSPRSRWSSSTTTRPTSWPTPPWRSPASPAGTRSARSSASWRRPTPTSSVARRPWPSATPRWPCWSAGPAAAPSWPGWPAPPSGPDASSATSTSRPWGAPAMPPGSPTGPGGSPGVSCRSPRSRPASTPRPSTSHASGPATSAPGSTTSTPRSWAGPPTPRGAPSGSTRSPSGVGPVWRSRSSSPASRPAAGSTGCTARCWGGPRSPPASTSGRRGSSPGATSSWPSTWPRAAST